MKEQRFDLVYNGANLMKVDSKDGNFIPVSALAERDKLIDEMLEEIKYIGRTNDYNSVRVIDLINRAEAMRGGKG